MAKEKNAKCASLASDFDPEHYPDCLQTLMEVQEDIQTNVYGFDFDKMRQRTGDVVEFFKDMNLAIDDERMEQYEALGGISTYGKAVWKKWKKDHEKATSRPLCELTQNELLELKYELVDELHFFFNKCIAIELGPDELFRLYMAKNKENIDRQKRGY